MENPLATVFKSYSDTYTTMLNNSVA